MNRAIVVSLISLVSLFFFSSQSSITVTANSASYDFGQQMTFNLSAESPAGIIGAILFVQAGGDARTQVTAAAFAPGPAIAATVTRDLRRQPISPFNVVTYWWRINDGSGAEITTDPATVFYEDNRFDWQTAQRDTVTAHWYDGDAAFGQSAADIGAAALPRINVAIGAPLPEAVNLYIYNSCAELQAGLQLAGRRWVCGQADPSLGVALVAVAPGPEAGLGLERDVPHELTHLLIYQVTAPNYAAVPFWLNEGLAVVNESQPDPTFRTALEAARRSESLMPLRELCGAFPLDPASATLAYAESESIVRYIRDRWGAPAVAGLLQAYAEGASCEGGVQRVLGTSLSGLQSDWSREALNASPSGALARDLAPYLPLFLLPCLSLLGLLFAPRRKPVVSGNP